MLLASRLKVMLADLGLTPETAAQALHVTPRTVRYWISGKTLVPYAAYRLLRILAGAELSSPDRHVRFLINIFKNQTTFTEM